MTSGNCKSCGSGNLKYGDSDVDGEALYYEFKCKDCGKKGKEWYNLVFTHTEMEE